MALSQKDYYYLPVAISHHIRFTSSYLYKKILLLYQYEVSGMVNLTQKYASPPH